MRKIESGFITVPFSASALPSALFITTLPSRWISLHIGKKLGSSSAIQKG